MIFNSKSNKLLLVNCLKNVLNCPEIYVGELFSL